jgi:cytochrome c-type biogenesis protein CcmE
MTRKTRRLITIAGLGSVLALAVGLVLYALNDSIVFFYGPTEVVEKQIKAGARLRVGGLVKTGSVVRQSDRKVEFVVSDGNHEITIHYDGLLPDLFREGQGVVAEGKLEAGMRFAADTVLAKHDENYMPREVADSLKKQGHWQGETKAEPPKGAKP